MYDDEFKTMGNVFLTKDKIEPQHHQLTRYTGCRNTSHCQQQFKNNNSLV